MAATLNPRAKEIPAIAYKHLFVFRIRKSFQYMAQQNSRDLRANSRKAKFGYKGNTIRALNIAEHSLRWNTLNCEMCQGVCILSNFNDHMDRKDNYKHMLDPKYHRNIIEDLKALGLTPDPNGICRPYEDFKSVSETSNQKQAQIEVLGYDPDSTEFLSQKQKAKLKKNKLKEEELKLSKEEWIVEEFGSDELKDALNLYYNYEKLNIEVLNERVQCLKTGVANHCTRVGRSNAKGEYLVIGNKIRGFLPSHKTYKSRGRPHHKSNQLALLEFHKKDFVLTAHKSQKSDLF
mgnify:CR=1 FL=1